MSYLQTSLQASESINQVNTLQTSDVMIILIVHKYRSLYFDHSKLYNLQVDQLRDLHVHCTFYFTERMQLITSVIVITKSRAVQQLQPQQDTTGYIV